MALISFSEQRELRGGLSKTTGAANASSSQVMQRQTKERFTVPFWTSAIDFTDHYELDDKFNGHEVCSSGTAVDAATTKDTKCWAQDSRLCYVGWTEPKEWLQYAFRVSEPRQSYDVTVSLGSVSTEKRVLVEIPGVASRAFHGPGAGWTNFWTYTWTVELSPGDYNLELTFLDGDVNVCSVSVEDSNTPPLWPPESNNFVAGDFSQGKLSSDAKLHISNGLTCNVVAETGKNIALTNRRISERLFHDAPDAAGVIRKPKSDHYFYMSNVEKNEPGDAYDKGGVGVLEFNANGEVVAYEKIANHLKRPCGGGLTPWGSWVLGEEIEGGQIWQVSPDGRHELTEMGSLGFYETIAFYYDNARNKFHAYATRDTGEAVLTRYTANDDGMECYRQKKDKDRWCALSNGEVDYLVLSGDESFGTFSWTNDFEYARTRTSMYENSEGIAIANGNLYFVSKTKKRLFTLDLQKETYTYESTQYKGFNDEPDQIVFLNDNEDILYLCEEGGFNAGLFGRKKSTGWYFAIAKGVSTWDGEEVSGVSWSPDSKHLYFAYLESGVLYDCTRDDGLGFDDSYDIVYL